MEKIELFMDIIKRSRRKLDFSRDYDYAFFNFEDINDGCEIKVKHRICKN